MIISFDSMAALAYSKDPEYHGKTKHIQMRYHFFIDMIAQSLYKENQPLQEVIYSYHAKLTMLTEWFELTK